MGKKHVNKQYAVIGLGVFGSTIAKTLSRSGCEVLAVDKNLECVERIADDVTKAVQADATDIDELTSLGIQDFDVVVVAIGNHLEDSILTVMNAKELGVKHVIAKAKNKTFMQILDKVGADRVVRPEKEMGMKIAKSLMRHNIVDLVELDPEYCVVEMIAPHQWVGKSLKILNVRAAYGFNILGVKYAGEDKLRLSVDPDYAIREGDHFLVVAETKKAERFDHNASLM